MVAIVNTKITDKLAISYHISADKTTDEDGDQFCFTRTSCNLLGTVQLVLAVHQLHDFFLKAHEVKFACYYSVDEHAYSHCESGTLN